jgi:hypothetical protein
VRFEFIGPDLIPSQLATEKIECPGPCPLLRLKINGGTALLTDKIKNDPNIHPIRPEGTKSLGNFFISNKPLTGTGEINKIQPIDGSIVLIVNFRIFGGNL